MDVLMIEANPEFGRFVKTLAEARGHAVELCTHHGHALQIFRSGAFDLVLVDVGLPDEPADRLIRQLKGVRPEIGIVVMTDHNSYEMEVRIRDLGVLYYLIKPLEIEDLEPLLEHMARRKGSSSEESITNHGPGNRPDSVFNTPKNHSRKPEVLNMSIEPGEIIPSDTGLGNEGICSTCEHFSSCMLRRRNQRPVLFCEEYQPASPPNASNRAETTNWGGRVRSGSSHMGLCRTCRKLSHCAMAKPGGGTWHCADYEEDES